MRVLYLGLEPYRERYTEFLTGWVEAAALREGVSLDSVVPPMGGVDGIRTGRVLDAHRRCVWGCQQVAEAVERLRSERYDWVLVEDCFTPGFEALPYCLEQTWWREGRRPRIAVRNWAQSVDVFDFTHPWRGWMRPFEGMVDHVSSVTFVASSEHAALLHSCGLDSSAVEVVGLPFDSAFVAGCVGGPLPYSDRAAPPRVVYSSRLDSEKDPLFFLRVAEGMRGEAEFVVCSGAAELRSNVPAIAEAFHRAADEGLIQVRVGLSKLEYYTILRGAMVQFNCALQDWVSFTALDASALGVQTVAPCFRGFPEALGGQRSESLYTPGRVDGAIHALRACLSSPAPVSRIRQLAEFHDGTIPRMFDAMRRFL